MRFLYSLTTYFLVRLSLWESYTKKIKGIRTMKMLLKIGGIILLFLAIFYLATILFPSFFSPHIHNSLSRQTYQTKSPIITPRTAEDYVLMTCGSDCSKCNGSGTGCAQYMIEQAQLMCSDGKKNDAVCYYDLLTLTKVCESFCKGPKSSTPATPEAL